MTDQAPARIAYVAYGTATGGLNHRGEPMPDWEQLPAGIQAAWTAAALAVLALAAVLEIPRPDPLPPLQLRRNTDAAPAGGRDGAGGGAVTAAGGTSRRAKSSATASGSRSPRPCR